MSTNVVAPIESSSNLNYRRGRQTKGLKNKNKQDIILSNYPYNRVSPGSTISNDSPFFNIIFKPAVWRQACLTSMIHCTKSIIETVAPFASLWAFKLAQLHSLLCQVVAAAAAVFEVHSPV